MTAPSWATPEVMDKLKVLKDFAFRVRVTGTNECGLVLHYEVKYVCEKTQGFI